MKSNDKILKKKLNNYITQVNLEINNPPRYCMLTGIIEYRTLLTSMMGVIIKPLIKEGRR